ncbi:MAG TPA: protein phosphatase 2C domain-containing protein [Gemmatimonadales bacterium]|nr:protein phosphatase 2C domain-containing protein [Gemmatimonadales bacterium]
MTPPDDAPTRASGATETPVQSDAAGRKPRDEEIEFYGLTHRGKVRENNQDHFLVCSLKKHVDVHLTSLPQVEQIAGRAERLAFLAMVADGVGSGPHGEEASRFTAETVTRYVIESMHCYYTADATDDTAFTRALEEAAVRVHVDIAERAASDATFRGMATTLTLWISVWPRSYLLQVGDSRCYTLYEGVLRQISRDQTMAQELVDSGVMSRTEAYNTRWANVLSSSIGGPQSAPVVTRIPQRWGAIGLLCTDGLTKHVSDERIEERLRTMTTPKQACEALVQDALDGGGGDNITVIVGRTVRRD